MNFGPIFSPSFFAGNVTKRDSARPKKPFSSLPRPQRWSRRSAPSASPPTTATRRSPACSRAATARARPASRASPGPSRRPSGAPRALSSSSCRLRAPLLSPRTSTSSACVTPSLIAPAATDRVENRWTMIAGSIGSCSSARRGPTSSTPRGRSGYSRATLSRLKKIAGAINVTFVTT